MKKLVIVDRGASNIGKSAAIKSVYYLLMSKGYELSINNGSKMKMKILG